MVETGAQKRKAEGDAIAIAHESLGQSAQPASKKVKIEHEQAPVSAHTVKSEPAVDAGRSASIAEAPNAAEGLAKQEAEVKAESEAAVKAEDTVNNGAAVKAEKNTNNGTETPEAEADADPPRTLGFKTFQNGDEAFQYFHTLVHDLRHDQDLNEYEHEVVLALVTQGHPEPETKIGSGVRAIQVREHEQMDSTCFYLLRNDGTDDNFSVRKCICKLYPKWGDKNKRQSNETAPRGGGRGGRGSGGRGGGGRSSGGRGARGGRRGRGRGRARS